MQDLTDHGRRVVADVARRHGVSVDAVAPIARSLAAGHGAQAQFSHAELGGMGQWSRGGMTMVGDMFNNALKARVDAICTDLAEHVAAGEPLFAPSPALSGAAGAGSRWPAGLGQPASAGSQNDMRYAVFPATRRLAVERDGRVSVYDTGDHRIGGVAQQQGGRQTLRFTSQHGAVEVGELRLVSGADDPRPISAEPPASRSEPAPPTKAAALDEDIFVKIERLHDLHTRGILSAEEFEAKKAELLGRL